MIDKKEDSDMLFKLKFSRSAKILTEFGFHYDYENKVFIFSVYQDVIKFLLVMLEYAEMFKKNIL